MNSLTILTLHIKFIRHSLESILYANSYYYCTFDEMKFVDKYIVVNTKEPVSSFEYPYTEFIDILS